MQLDFIGFDQVLYDNGNVAIGWSVSAQGNQAIAIGAGSDTSRAATAVPSTTLNGTTYYFAGGATTLAGDQVSIGRVGYERQIKNVAAGETLTIDGGAAESRLRDNIGVVSDGSKLTVKLSEDLDLGASGSIDMGDTYLNDDGMTVVNDALACILTVFT